MDVPIVFYEIRRCRFSASWNRKVTRREVTGEQRKSAGDGERERETRVNHAAASEADIKALNKQIKVICLGNYS